MAGGRLVKECYERGAGEARHAISDAALVWAPCPNVLISFLAGDRQDVNFLLTPSLLSSTCIIFIIKDKILFKKPNDPGILWCKEFTSTCDEIDSKSRVYVRSMWRTGTWPSEGGPRRPCPPLVVGP